MASDGDRGDQQDRNGSESYQMAIGRRPPIACEPQFLRDTLGIP